jgi:hypothetical protein
MLVPVACGSCAPTRTPRGISTVGYKGLRVNPNLSHHHNCMHSPHAKPPEAVVGELEHELVETVRVKG